LRAPLSVPVRTFLGAGDEAAIAGRRHLNGLYRCRRADVDHGNGLSQGSRDPEPAHRRRQLEVVIVVSAVLIGVLDVAHTSSLGCAICDPVIAIWCFGGGRPIQQLRRRLASTPK
jgi:hypothetical protein